MARLALGGLLVLGEFWEKENLRFPRSFPVWPLNESACEKDRGQVPSSQRLAFRALS